MNAGTTWMKVKALDKKLKSFFKLSLAILLPFALVIALLSYIYRSFTITQYNLVLLILIAVSIIIVLILALSTFAIFMALKKRRTSAALLIPVRLGMKLALPFAIFVAGLFKGDKDAIRSLFIDLNNIIVQSANPIYEPNKVLLLLPHCLQNNLCDRKITGDIHNCKQCGACAIGSILRLVTEKGVDAKVVTGGTAARNLVAREKPDVILSVACERDLSSGISDIGRIPVIGVLNKRPNGPCFNTTVDIELLAEKLDMLLGIRKKGNNGD
jgi:hypothetical protein